LKLQTVGISRGFEQAIVRGDPVGRSFSVIYLRDGRIVAVDAVNMVRDYTHGRLLVQAGASIEPALLQDAAVPLKAHLTA
jgi:3-phenylpropionate/trans-cinnamate dioxygenase ferredoxin reductase subunit